MSNAIDQVRDLLGREPKPEEVKWFEAIDAKIAEHGESSASVLPVMLQHDDLLGIGVNLDLVSDYVQVVGRVDVAPNNDCATRTGTVSVRLPVGYTYYDHRVVENSANPRPGNISVTPLPTGVDVAWSVKSIADVWPWGCSGPRSWLDADVFVRGVRS